MANKEKIEEKKLVVEYHIFDFLIRCNINRNQHQVLMLKFGNNPMQTKEEWEKITNLKMVY